MSQRSLETKPVDEQVRRKAPPGWLTFGQSHIIVAARNGDLSKKSQALEGRAGCVAGKLRAGCQSGLSWPPGKGPVTATQKPCLIEVGDAGLSLRASAPYTQASTRAATFNTAS